MEHETQSERGIVSIDVAGNDLAQAIFSRLAAGDNGLLIEVIGTGEYRMANVVDPNTAAQSENPILSPEGFFNSQTWEIADTVEIEGRDVEVNLV